MIIKIDKREIKTFGGTISGKTAMELLKVGNKEEYYFNNERIPEEEFLKTEMNIVLATEKRIDGDNIPLLARLVLTLI